MGIQLISAPKGSPSNEPPGPMSLPAEFDRKKFASKWVKQGPAVDAAREREWIPGTQLTADGWEVWKNEEGKPFTVALLSGVYILLHRFKAVQEAVNAICGNIGKERLLQEKRGETTGGVLISDTGMLSDEKLSKTIGKEEMEEGVVKFNDVPNVERDRVEAPAARTTSTTAKRVRRSGATE